MVESMSREDGKTVYISYSRRAEYSLIKRLIAENEENQRFVSCRLKDDKAMVDELPKKKDEKSDVRIEEWDIRYDENRIGPGDSISAFMAELGGADRVIILL